MNKLYFFYTLILFIPIQALANYPPYDAVAISLGGSSVTYISPFSIGFNQANLCYSPPKISINAQNRYGIQQYSKVLLIGNYRLDKSAIGISYQAENGVVLNQKITLAFAKKFNQNISNWDVSSVTNMMSMFGDAESFNQSLNEWDTSSVTNMSSMFVNAFSFNSFLGHWDVSNVTNMNNMFAFATSFNQELEEYWDVNKVTDCGGFSSESKMKTKPKFTKCNPN